MNKKSIVSAFVMGCVYVCASAQVYLDTNIPLEDRVQDALSRMTVHEKVSILHAQSKFTSAGVPRLGIRQLNMSDGPHGCREEVAWDSWDPAHWTNDSCVAFPSLTCLAATWNRALSSTYGNAVSEEFAYRGKDVMLGPGLNIMRMPLNGRSFEYMGEDPYLTGEMAVPYIQAAQKNGIGCCIKHFFLNSQETDRTRVNVNISERAVEEIYLPAFEKAIKVGEAWSIMGAYNKWQNEWCCQNDSLLNGILKKRWGFDGAVMSDWNGAHNTEKTAFGGLDLEMGTDNKTTQNPSVGYKGFFMSDPLEKLVNEGKVPMEILNDKAARVLRTIFRTAMNPNKVIGNQCSEAHYNACLKIGEEGIVLLKNEKGILPLSSEKYGKILIVGDNATRSMSYGGGSSELKTKRDYSPLEELQALYGNKVSYVQGYTAGKSIYNKVDPIDPNVQDSLKQEALTAAKDADLILFIGGMNKNHHQDCEDGDREDYNLSYGQNELISELAKIQKNIVVITFGGNPFATPWITQVKAMVHCWYLGSMSGKSLANVLSGAVNPSGKLPITFAKKQADYPCFQYGKEGYPGVDKQVAYNEGIYVGYRHFDTKHVQPQFPFGFGLSYTTFKYGTPTTSATTISKEGTLLVRIPVTNTGTRKGKEVVQLYISQPKSSVDRPAKELKGFEKVELEPGETKTIQFTITPRDLAYYNEQTHTWTTESGKYNVHIGASETDIRGTLSVQYR